MAVWLAIDLLGWSVVRAWHCDCADMIFCVLPSIAYCIALGASVHCILMLKACGGRSLTPLFHNMLYILMMAYGTDTVFLGCAQLTSNVALGGITCLAGIGYSFPVL